MLHSELIIASGASINDKNLTGETALYYAAQRADPDAVSALIDAGANVNAKNDKGMSPLHLAQRELASDESPTQGRGDVHKRRVQDVIDLLLAAGACRIVNSALALLALKKRSEHGCRNIAITLITEWF